MKKKSKPIKAWCVKSPKGKLFVDTLSSSKNKTIDYADVIKDYAAEDLPCTTYKCIWENLWSLGYRVVRVKIEEM